MAFNTINNNRSLLAFVTLVFLFLLSFNGFSIFSVKIPSIGHSPVKLARVSRNLISVSPVSSVSSVSSDSSDSPLIEGVKEENPSEISIPHLNLQTQSPELAPVKLARVSRNLISGSPVSSVSSDSSESPLIEGIKDENPSDISIPHLNLQTQSPELAPATAVDPIDFVSVPFFKHEVRNPHPYPNVNADPDTYLPHLRKSHSFEIESENASENRNKKLLKMLTGFGSTRRRRADDFPARVKEFFSKKVNETSSCKVRFFMTWISPLNSFNETAFHSVESIFKIHPNGCLLIVSNSLDSIKGRQILKPFTEKGFKVAAIAPGFDFLFKNTMAETWFSRLIRGHIHAGDIPLGQNISNLLRLCLLYKYGGIYIDTDVIILRSFSKLKNSIGAQTMDVNSKNWSRLNNAVLVFERMHPLLYKFIEEFALTFNGNKWGHNGPYLVSRVVARLQGRPGYNFTVLPPMAFYPVNWDKVRILFRGAKNETDSKWLKVKFEQIRNQSYTLHLWNKQSRGLQIEQGSIVRKILSDHCIFCNTSSTNDYIVSSIE